jgi:hypothetical protein
MLGVHGTQIECADAPRLITKRNAPNGGKIQQTETPASGD